MMLFVLLGTLIHSLLGDLGVVVVVVVAVVAVVVVAVVACLLYTSPSPRDATLSRMPSSA